MAQKVRWGVIGTAKIGTENVIPAMQRCQFGSIDAIASRDAEKGRSVAAHLGIPRSYGSYAELLADPEIDAVYNPLPNHLHVPLSVQAMEAGKHVLCEKPIALDANGARELADVSARTGRLVAEAFMVRHHLQWQQAKAIIDGGRIGDLRLVQVLFSYFLDDPENIRNKAEVGGGGLYDIGCYAINAGRYLFGSEPKRVVGLMEFDPAMKTDRLMSGLADFGGGRHLDFSCATQLVPTQRVQALGARGRLAIEIPFNPPPDQATRITLDDGRDLTGEGREVIAVPACNQYTAQGDAFSLAVLGRQPLLWGIEDAVGNMRVIDAFFRSARSNGWEQT